MTQSNMEKHELVNTFTVNTPSGGLSLQEWKCGPKYVVAGEGADYCPRCGGEL